MSISSALSNALSGLNAATRDAELISNNVANALTPGYSARSAERSAALVGGTGAGVAISGVRVAADPVTTAARMRSDADLGAQAETASALNRIADRMGLPGDSNALTERAAAFERALQSAASEPSSDAALRQVANTGERFVESIGALSTEIQRIRVDSDAKIAAQVNMVNQGLKSIEMLNREIRMRSQSGGDTSALIDQRKSLIDEIAGVLPIRSVPREGGAVALFTQKGATLIDGPAAELGFTRTPIITQDMTLASGALSGITINDRPVEIGTGGATALLDGGSLGSLFAVRDQAMPELADQLDALAADLITRFEDSGVDPSLAPGDAGLFTDAGNAFNAAVQEGLAARLSVNAAVDPAQGGDLWRLRDGIGAAAPGPTGDGRLLSALFGAATDPRVPDPSFGTTSAFGVAGLAASLTDTVRTLGSQAETEETYMTALNTSLREAESALTGVNTDTEMQRLLLVEQSYAANARVMSTVDQMIRTLLEI